MATSQTYGAIAVVDVDEQKNSVVSVISVRENEVSLSGLWILNSNQISELSDICANKSILSMSKELPFKTGDTKDISLEVLRKIAISENLLAMTSWEEFKALEPKKRKKLVQPDFFAWDQELQIEDYERLCRIYNRFPDFKETDAKAKRVLAVSYLVQFLIQKWQSDEQERCQRDFIRGTNLGFRILPESWLP